MIIFKQITVLIINTLLYLPYRYLVVIISQIHNYLVSSYSIKEIYNLIKMKNIINIIGFKKILISLISFLILNISILNSNLRENIFVGLFGFSHIHIIIFYICSVKITNNSSKILMA